MSRSGYSESCEGWELIMWRGAVASAIRGKRGQVFLRKLLTALDALPAKRLIAHELEKDGEVCALGSVGKLESINLASLSPNDHVGLGSAFGIPRALVQEIEFINDDEWGVTPEQRFDVVRNWASSKLNEPTNSK